MWFHLIFVRKFRLRLHRQLLLMVRSFWMSSFVWWSLKWELSFQVHPGRLTWNLQITHLERNMIFQTSWLCSMLIFRGVAKWSRFQKENLCFRKMVNQKGGGWENRLVNLYLRPWLLPFSAGFHDGLGCHAHGTHWSMGEGGPSLRYSKFVLHKLQEVTPTIHHIVRSFWTICASGGMMLIFLLSAALISSFHALSLSEKYKFMTVVIVNLLLYISFCYTPRHVGCRMTSSRRTETLEFCPSIRPDTRHKKNHFSLRNSRVFNAVVQKVSNRSVSFLITFF